MECENLVIFVLLRHKILVKQKLKTKNPAGKPAGFAKAILSLAFAELEVLARAGLAGFFALAHAGVAMQQALGFEGGAQLGVVLQQRAGDA